MIKYNDSDTIKRSSGIHPQLFSLKKAFWPANASLKLHLKIPCVKSIRIRSYSDRHFPNTDAFHAVKLVVHFLTTLPFISMLSSPLQNSKAVPRRYSVETVLLKLSQNSQEYTCARVSF